MPTSSRSAPLRLFLDAGVLVEGFFSSWGSCKGVLILAAMGQQFRAVIAESVMNELAVAIERKVARLPDAEAQVVHASIAGWFRYATPEALPLPSPDELLQHQSLLAAVRHGNDMPSVVAAVLARPDWVLSTNTKHWNQDLATRTGLRIAMPYDFLCSLEPDVP